MWQPLKRNMRIKGEKALCANNLSSLAKEETSGPFVVTCSSVWKNDEKKKNLKMYWCGVAIHFRLKFQSSLQKLAYEGF